MSVPATNSRQRYERATAVTERRHEATVTTTITCDDFAALDRLARAADITRSGYLRRLIREDIARDRGLATEYEFTP